MLVFPGRPWTQRPHIRCPVRGGGGGLNSVRFHQSAAALRSGPAPRCVQYIPLREETKSHEEKTRRRRHETCTLCTLYTTILYYTSYMGILHTRGYFTSEDALHMKILPEDIYTWGYFTSEGTIHMIILYTWWYFTHDSTLHMIILYSWWYVTSEYTTHLKMLYNWIYFTSEDTLQLMILYSWWYFTTEDIYTWYFTPEDTLHLIILYTLFLFNYHLKTSFSSWNFTLSWSLLQGSGVALWGPEYNK